MSFDQRNGGFFFIGVVGMIDMVQVGICGMWYIEVKDVVDVWNIDIVGSDVGGDQYVDVVVGQVFDSFVLFGLYYFVFQLVGVNFGFMQLVSQFMYVFVFMYKYDSVGGFWLL